MSTTAFQFVFDNMETFSIDRKAVVGQTISRNFNVRSVSRGPTPWRFELKMPDGRRWSDDAAAIKLIDAADRFTPGTVSLSHPGYADWLSSTPEFLGKTWTVMCVQLPKWTIFARDQVAWDGPFVFIEVPA